MKLSDGTMRFSQSRTHKSQGINETTLETSNEHFGVSKNGVPMGYPILEWFRISFSHQMARNWCPIPVEADAEVAGAAVAQVGQACENHRRSWWQSKGVTIIQCWCCQPQHQSSPSNDLCLINFDHVFSLDTELSYNIYIYLQPL